MFKKLLILCMFLPVIIISSERKKVRRSKSLGNLNAQITNLSYDINSNEIILNNKNNKSWNKIRVLSCVP